LQAELPAPGVVEVGQGGAPGPGGLVVFRGEVAWAGAITAQPRRRIASVIPLGTVPPVMSLNRTTGQTCRPAWRSAITEAASACIASSTSAKTAATAPICRRSWTFTARMAELTSAGSSDVMLAPVIAGSPIIY
jgi:hypothetical protein